MRRLVEFLVVVDAEGQAGLAHGGSGSGHLRRIKAGGYRRGNHVGADAMDLRNIHAQGVAGNLRVVPVDGKGDGSVSQHAEVECVVGILPDVLAAEDDPLAEGLLESGVEFVLEARLKRSRYAGRAGKQRGQHRIRASAARQHQVLIEGRLQCARIGDAQHGRRGLDVIGNADAGLRLLRRRQAVVHIAAQSQVEEPVGVAGVTVKASAAGKVVRREHRQVTRIHVVGA